jgi:choline dehydrogenase-like flavoprotein
MNLVAYPLKSDLDAWGELGNRGWNWESMLPYYRKFHTFIPPSDEIRKMLGLDYLQASSQGTSGPIQVSFGQEHGPLEKAWPATFANLNLKMTGDHLSGVATGGHSNPGSIDPRTKTRSHAGSAYYSEDVAKRSNLRILTEALVDKVLLRNSDGTVCAFGVQFTDRDKTQHIVKARKEVILAAGTLQSPQILELSGIGSSNLLHDHGIKTVISNQWVGENLQDHAVGHLSFEVEDGIPSADVFRDPLMVEALLTLYQTTKNGPFAASTFSSAFTPVVGLSGTSGHAELRSLLDKYVDLSTKTANLGYDQQMRLLRKILEDGDSSSGQYFLGPFQLNILDGHDPQKFLKPTTDGNYISILAALSHPFSRGSVHINSADPTQKPTFDPKYLSHPLDCEILVRHIQFLETIVETQPWASLLKKDGRRVPAGRYVRDLDVAREQAKLMISNYHPVGTCAMMPEELGGVVNERLLVHGTKNLRVVDASVIPLIPRGNIQSSVYAIAERAADIIKEDMKQKVDHIEVKASKEEDTTTTDSPTIKRKTVWKRLRGWFCFG